MNPEWLKAKAGEIRAAACDRLAALVDHSGCEAGAARRFEDGRLAALIELGLIAKPVGQPAALDENGERKIEDVAL